MNQENDLPSKRQEVVNSLLARNLFADKAPEGQEEEVLQELEHIRIDKPSSFTAFAALLSALAGDSQISYLSLCLTLSGLTSKTELFQSVGEVSFKYQTLTGTQSLARLIGTSPAFVLTLKKIVDAATPPADHDESETEAALIRGKRIGKRLQRLRRAVRMSYEALAYPEFAPTYIEGIEAGRIAPSDKALSVLCKKLEIEVKDFLLDIEAEKLED